MTGSIHRVRIATYFDADFKPSLEQLARSQKRSVSSMIEFLCEEAVSKAKKEGTIK